MVGSVRVRRTKPCRTHGAGRALQKHMAPGAPCREHMAPVGEHVLTMFGEHLEHVGEGRGGSTHHRATWSVLEHRVARELVGRRSMLGVPAGVIFG